MPVKSKSKPQVLPEPEKQEPPRMPRAMPHRKPLTTWLSESGDILYELENEFVLDLRGMASSLWVMSQGCRAESGMIADSDVHMALHWLHRELDRKADELAALVSGYQKALRQEGGAA